MNAHRSYARKASFRRRLVAAGPLAVLLATAGLAYAVPINGVVLTGGGGTIWDARVDETAWCIEDQPSIFTPVTDGETTTRGDAFDNGLMLLVDGKPFDDPDGDGRRKGQTLRVGPDKLRGLKISETARALQDSPTLRALYQFKNPQNHRVSRTVTVDSNLGSDGFTRIEQTSNGDQELTESDRWIVTSDASDPDSSDPPVTHVLSGKQAGTSVSEVRETPGEACEFGDFSDALIVDYEVSVPADSKRYLMVFAEMNDDSNAGAVAEAAKFDDKGLSNKLLKGLSDTVQNRILNWSL